MPLRIVEKQAPKQMSLSRQMEVRGLRNDFAKYERDIISGKIPCPFTVEFRDTRFDMWFVNVGRGGESGWRYKVLDEGKVVCRQPLPLTPDGKPKIKLF